MRSKKHRGPIESAGRSIRKKTLEIYLVAALIVIGGSLLVVAQPITILIDEDAGASFEWDGLYLVGLPVASALVVLAISATVAIGAAFSVPLSAIRGAGGARPIQPREGHLHEAAAVSVRSNALVGTGLVAAVASLLGTIGAVRSYVEEPSENSAAGLFLAAVGLGLGWIIATVALTFDDRAASALRASEVQESAVRNRLAWQASWGLGHEVLSDSQLAELSQRYKSAWSLVPAFIVVHLAALALLFALSGEVDSEEAFDLSGGMVLLAVIDWFAILVPMRRSAAWWHSPAKSIGWFFVGMLAPAVFGLLWLLAPELWPIFAISALLGLVPGLAFLVYAAVGSDSLLRQSLDKLIGGPVVRMAIRLELRVRRVDAVSRPNAVDFEVLPGEVV